MTQTFGEALRAARYRAGFETYRQFVAWLENQNLNYADETIGNWERGARKPDRSSLLKILEMLATRGAFRSLSEVNRLLDAGEYPRLSQAEAQNAFTGLPDDAVISNLPAKPYRSLIGRDRIVEEVGQRLQDQNALHVVTISGLGGIGKTAVAYEIVRNALVMGHFEHLLWQSVKSEEFISTSIALREAASSFTEALLGFGQQLGLEETLLHADRIQTALRERWLAGSYLIVLDNLETLEAAHYIVRELHTMVANSPRSRVLLTSRKRMAGESYLVDYHLKGLSEADTLAFLSDEARQRRAESLLQADAALLKRVYQVTEGMPLAIKLIVTQYLLGTALDEALDRLMGAVNEEQLYRFLYFDIWHHLTVEAQQLLVGAASVDSAMKRSTLLHVSELMPDAFSEAVPELVTASLMEVQSHPNADQQRYKLHAVTRWFVNIVLQGLWQSGDPSSM